MPSDVITAITAQNAEVAAGEVGAVPSAGPDAGRHGHRPVAPDQPAQFAQIVVKTRPAAPMCC
jgi:multidrug efflux pump